MHDSSQCHAILLSKFIYLFTAEVGKNEHAQLSRKMSRSMGELTSDQILSQPLEHRQSSLSDLSKVQSSVWRQLPLIKWSASDVQCWLQDVDLERFLPSFTEHDISGKDLAQISMQLLGEISTLLCHLTKISFFGLFSVLHAEHFILFLQINLTSNHWKIGN